MVRRAAARAGGAVLRAGIALAIGASTALAQAAGVTPSTPTPQRSLAVGTDSAQVTERAVSATFTSVRLADAIDRLALLSRVPIVYSDRVVPVDRRVTARLADVPVLSALETLLTGTGIVARRSGNRIILVRGDGDETRRLGARAVSIVWGQVTDSANGRPLPGATLELAGEGRQSTVANDSGYYFFQRVPSGVHPLRARKIGYRPAETVILVADSQVVRVDVALSARLDRLDAVVVTATGRQRRVELGNDIVSINVDSVMLTAPVHSVTDLLETRVPGLEVQRTSGAPGSPARIRLRGLSSLHRSNEPILVVDGVRMNASESRSRSLATSSVLSQNAFLTPSLIDQIDPNSIETIEVMKGPSAASLYGPDAANGVIVLTTKRGRPGPTRWQATVSQGLTTLPGSYPVNVFRWGHSIAGGVAILCARTQYDCMQDSLVRFQALNDPRYTVFGTGSRRSASVTASGGSAALSHDFTVSYFDEVGLLRLPDIEVERFRRFRGTNPPSWMERPQRLTTWSGTSHLTAQLSPKATVDFRSTLSSSNQQQSSLDGAISRLQGAWIDRSQLDQNGVVSGFQERATSASLRFANAASLNWMPRSWLTGFANLGLDVSNQDDKALVPAGLVTDNPQLSTGHFGRGTAHDVTTSLNAGATTFAPLPRGMRVTTVFGMNLTRIRQGQQAADRFGLVSDEEPSQFTTASEQSLEQTTLGWFVEPRLEISPRLHLSPGFRIDGGSTTGRRARFNGLPKIDASWLVSEERFFPLRRVVNTLRLRAAYGHATVQPGLTDQLRTYMREVGVAPDGSDDPVARLRLLTLGNTRLRPERSVELEGGFDIWALDNRVGVQVTQYDKVRRDAIERAAVAPSVGGGPGYNTNIGVIRNSGTELSLQLEPVRTRLATLNVGVNFSRNVNRLVRLAPGERALIFNDFTRLAPGYPLFGFWMRPIVGFSDANVDGVIDSTEVVVGDSVVFVGQADPRWHASFPLSTTLFGRVTVHATIDYRRGMTQFNRAAGSQNTPGNRIWNLANDPAAPLAQQAAVAALDRTPYGLIETVNVLRFNSFSVSMPVASGVARRLGASTMSVALQGTNLGLRTSYRGIDPAVNAFSSGESTADTGQQPAPRTWILTVHLTK